LPQSPLTTTFKGPLVKIIGASTCNRDLAPDVFGHRWMRSKCAPRFPRALTKRFPGHSSP
jgi:hypothetical protein